MKVNIEHSLGVTYKPYFKIGAAVTVDDLSGVHRDLLKQHFNSITAENAMKFGEIHPEENRYDFDKADRMAAFARENDLKMRGHTFVWHSQTSHWVFAGQNGKEASRELVLERLRAHVKVICDRYKDVVYAWDVVNEAIEDKTGELYRDTKWRRTLGEDYIKTAFELVREFDQNAALVYNDYNNEQPEKLDKTCRMLETLLRDGTPVDTVGIQAHWNIWDKRLVDNLKRAIERYAALGLKIHITEMDLSVFDFNDRRTDVKSPTAEMLDLQARLYEQLFSVFRAYSEHITSVTFWGISDRHTWKDNFPAPGRKDWPMLFDTSGAPKASFEKVISF